LEEEEEKKKEEEETEAGVEDGGDEGPSPFSC
jgi:hypothetical protein